MVFIPGMAGKNLTWPHLTVMRILEAVTTTVTTTAMAAAARRREQATT
ncbi:hypothetical protein [Brenneria goodwinii]|nr:hypothetical protein [Brenneria goodwinii]